MKPYLLALLGIAACSLPLEGKTEYGSKNEFYKLMGHQDIDRLLLVTFSDNTINSVKVTASPTSSFCVFTPYGAMTLNL